MKAGPIIGIVVIVAAIVYGAVSFKQSLVAYVPFKDAMASADSGRTVQVIGALVQGKTHYDLSSGSLQFQIQEASTSLVMPVVFKSPKPDNFDAAAKVTAIGHYDPASASFEADNLLVKCPSKYADQKDAPTRSYGTKT